MLWYVIQTFTGREEKLIRMMRRIVPRELYGDCFAAYHEQLRHRGQENQIHVERIFPGYVFVTSDEPDRLFLFLKNVPAMSKMMSDGEFYFLPLETAEARLLADIMDEDHVIRLSYVATDGKDHISYVAGPLEAAIAAGAERIAGYQFRLLSATEILQGTGLRQSGGADQGAGEIPGGGAREYEAIRKHRPWALREGDGK